MHLLYSRFFTKAMRDLGLVARERAVPQAVQPGPDPGRRRRADVASRRGNVQDPDELVARYGADTVRLFLMFMGPWDQGGPWSPTGIGGVAKFLNRVWAIAIDPHGTRARRRVGGPLPAGETSTPPGTALRAAAHRTLRDVTEDYEAFRWNTMVAKLMELSNTLFRYRGTVGRRSCPSGTRPSRLLLLMLAPAAPHITEELWSRRLEARGEPWASIHVQRGRRSTSAPSSSRRARSRSRSTASCATGSPCRPGSREIELEQIVMARDKVVDGDRRRARRAGHPRRRRQARQHRPARLAVREPAGSRRHSWRRKSRCALVAEVHRERVAVDVVAARE